MVGAEIKNQTLVQYCHDYRLNIFSKTPILSYQLNDTKENISSGVVQDKDFIGMSPDSSVSYNLETLKPGETKELVIYLYFENRDNKITEEESRKQIEELRKLDVNKELISTEKYWKKYVKEHLGIELKEETTEYQKKFNKIYKRSILLFPLLTNETTGGISAAVEIDENMTQCGKYSYCWPRDAVFVAKALDKLKMK